MTGAGSNAVRGKTWYVCIRNVPAVSRMLLCEKIRPARQVSYARAAADIHKLLDARHRRNCQKTWLSELVRTKKACGCPDALR